MRPPSGAAVLDEVLDLHSDERLTFVELGNVIHQPIPVDIRVEIGALERVASQVKY